MFDFQATLHRRHSNLLAVFVAGTAIVLVSGCNSPKLGESREVQRADNNLEGIAFYLYGYFPPMESAVNFDGYVNRQIIENRGGMVLDTFDNRVDYVILGLVPGTFDIIEHTNYISDISTREAQLQEYAEKWSGLLLKAEELDIFTISAFEFNRRIGRLDTGEIRPNDSLQTRVWDTELESVGRSRSIADE